jgi:hypothetical protein
MERWTPPVCWCEAPVAQWIEHLTTDQKVGGSTPSRRATRGNEELADRRVRLDPLDPKTSRHLPQCEYVSETDPVVLKVLLKVKPGAGGGYDWVECGACGAGWQVPHYAESVR